MHRAHLEEPACLLAVRLEGEGYGPISEVMPRVLRQPDVRLLLLQRLARLIGEPVVPLPLRRGCVGGRVDATVHGATVVLFAHIDEVVPHLVAQHHGAGGLRLGGDHELAPKAAVEWVVANNRGKFAALARCVTSSNSCQEKTLSYIWKSQSERRLEEATDCAPAPKHNCRARSARCRGRCRAAACPGGRACTQCRAAGS
jgi:hypothetical protein